MPEHLLFTVNSGDKDFIIYNAEALSDDPINLADLRYLDTQDMDARRSEAWSANVKWFFVIQPEGMYLLNTRNRTAVFCPVKSNVFIELFLKSEIPTKKRGKVIQLTHRQGKTGLVFRGRKSRLVSSLAGKRNQAAFCIYMKKIKIDFQKLTGRYYYLTAIQFEAFNWLLKTGLPFSAKTGRWTRTGVDQLLYGYSANNHESCTDITVDFSRTLELAFYRALYASGGSIIEAWREQENIRPGKYRMLSFLDDRPDKPSYDHHSFDIHREIYCLYQHVGGLLIKERFHPDYPRRTGPYIKKIGLSTYGAGYRVRMEFTFKECESSGWSHDFCQYKNESFERFIWRANTEIFKLRLPYEKDSHAMW